MSIFGDGRSDERRRRVLTEEVIGGGKVSGKTTGEPAARAEVEPRKRKSPEADRMDRHVRITDLVPKSYGALALWFLLGGGVIAGLESLYFYMPLLAGHTSDGRIRSFLLDGAGNLSACYSSLLLILATAVTLVIYSVRKHRADDYHARYRIWFAAALCWFALSIDQSAGLHHDFKEWMSHLAGERGFGDGALYWLGAYGVVLGFVGLRLVLEMKVCRTSTTFFVLSGIAFAAAVTVHLGFLPAEWGIQPTMLEEGLEMGGNLLLLLAMAVHARYVVLEADGEITARPTKAKKEKSKAKEAATTDEKPSRFGWFRRAKIDPAHATPAPAGRTSDLEPMKKADRVPSSAFRATTETLDAQSQRGSFKKVQADFSEEDHDGRDNRKLSKADRKAMRRQKDMERRYGQE